MSKNTIHFLCFLFLMSLLPDVRSQLLYEENFDIPGEGIMGPQPPTFQAPSGAWSLTGDFSALTASSDYVMTMTEAGESFLEAQDTDAVICFESEPIDISAYDSVKVMASLSEVGDLESSDFFDVYLWVDGVEKLIVNYQNLGSASHSLTGDKPDDEDFGEIDLEEKTQGNSLIIRICFKNNAGTEQLRIHQVKVEAFDTPTIDSADSYFTLINALTNLPISGYDSLPDQSNINLMRIKTALINFRYNASPQAERVRVGIGRAGQVFERMDDTLPYSLFGDVKGNYAFPNRDFIRLLWRTPKGPLDLYALEYKAGQTMPFRKTQISFGLSIGSYPLREALDEESSLFELYPNPSNGHCILQILPGMKEEDLELYIYDSQGKVVHRESLEGRFSLKLDMNEKVKGMYFVKLQGVKNQYLKRLILQ